MDAKYKILIFVIMVFAAGSLAFNPPRENPESVYPPDSLIRLHVVANSDSAFDQVLKKQVRDKIILDLRPEFLGSQDIQSARAMLEANLGRIRETACREIKARGKDYPVDVELASYAFPTKHYGAFVLPAGDYEAVRVVIGAGGGANWWCVLFPPLCFVNMSQTTPPPGGDNVPAVDDCAVEYRFRILDFFKIDTNWRS